MTADIQHLQKLSAVNPKLRAIKLPQDLSEVADLVELCFAATLDTDGKRFIRQMRQAGHSRSRIQGFSNFPPTIKGFVWVEDDQIVGNINLIPVLAQSRKSYLIANVSVHPDYRRQGIAHALTEASLAFASERRVRSVWLQVDEGNDEAQRLYSNYGFAERARRTVWHSQPGQTKLSIPPSVRVKNRRRSDWQLQKKWLNTLYDQEVRWNLPLHTQPFLPGIGGAVLRMFHEQKIRQWSALHHGKWIGSLIWQSSHSQADWLWLAAPPEKRELAICALIPHARQDLHTRSLVRPMRTLAINFPAGESANAFETIGFNPHQTLIWMKKELG
jgi:ribosomal protein S18 acetylase RimI-like enzyme